MLNFAAVLALISALLPRISHADDLGLPLATAIQLSPQVEIHRGMNHQALKQGAAIHVEDRIRTSPKGSTGIKFEEDVVVRLLQNSDMTFRAETQEGSACLLQLAKGQLLASVGKREKGSFRIFSNQGVAALREGRAQMDSTASHSEIRVLDGAVEFTGLQGGPPLLIHAGQKALFPAGNKPKKMSKAELASLRKAFKHKVFK